VNATGARATYPLAAAVRASRAERDGDKLANELLTPPTEARPFKRKSVTAYRKPQAFAQLRVENSF